MKRNKLVESSFELGAFDALVITVAGTERKEGM